MTKKEIAALTPKQIEFWQSASDWNKTITKLLDDAGKAFAAYTKPYQNEIGLIPDDIRESAEYKHYSAQWNNAKAEANTVYSMLFGRKIGSGLNTIHQLRKAGIIC